MINGPGSSGNEEVLHISQGPGITGTSLSDCLSKTLIGGSYPSAEVQSVYSTAPADRAIHRLKCQTVLF